MISHKVSWSAMSMISHKISWWDISVVEIILVIQVIQLNQVMLEKLAHLWPDFRVIVFTFHPQFLLPFLTSTASYVCIIEKVSDFFNLTTLKLANWQKGLVSQFYTCACMHNWKGLVSSIFTALKRVLFVKYLLFTLTDVNGLWERMPLGHFWKCSGNGSKYYMKSIHSCRGSSC